MGHLCCFTTSQLADLYTVCSRLLFIGARVAFLGMRSATAASAHQMLLNASAWGSAASPAHPRDFCCMPWTSSHAFVTTHTHSYMCLSTLVPLDTPLAHAHTVSPLPSLIATPEPTHAAASAVLEKVLPAGHCSAPYFTLLLLHKCDTWHRSLPHSIRAKRKTAVILQRKLCNIKDAFQTTNNMQTGVCYAHARKLSFQTTQ